jgi:hypothetical protein
VSGESKQEQGQSQEGQQG